MIEDLKSYGLEESKIIELENFFGSEEKYKEFLNIVGPRSSWNDFFNFLGESLIRYKQMPKKDLRRIDIKQIEGTEGYISLELGGYKKRKKLKAQPIEGSEGLIKDRR